MNLSSQIAKHFREVYFGGNWTVSNFKEQLSDVTWQESTLQIASLNTIATLSYHISYYVSILVQVLEGNPISGSDKLSFNHPPITSETEWDAFRNSLWSDAEKLILLIEQLPDEKWNNLLGEEKYGSYYRNFHGLIEHTHYHLGQIAVIKKMLRQNVK